MKDEEGFRGSILVVEDEPTIASVVARYLTQAGYLVQVAGDGPQALAAAKAHRPDLAVLDLMLPGMGGFEVMRRLRRSAGVVGRPAVIFLTARGDESDRVVGLHLGADDYVVKPFSPAELVARVDAVLRRYESLEVPAPLSFGALTIDAADRRVCVDGHEIPLTPTEFELLDFLARHPGRAFSRRELMQHVWGHAVDSDSATITVHVRRLRQKIEPDPHAPRWVETVWGIGYRFQP